MTDQMSHFELAATLLGLMLPLHSLVIFYLASMKKKIERLTTFAIEHEMLIDDYCKLKGIERADLPTRHRDGTLKANNGF